MKKLTPMMQQYMDIKEQHKDCLLLFRVGDFYELFFDDAILASKELELTLTGRNKSSNSEKTPMCGVPYMVADTYINKLVEKGYKVAVCDQILDSSSDNKLFKREVIKVVTKGTVMDTEHLDESKNNYVMSIYYDKNGIGIAFADISTGEFVSEDFPAGSVKSIIDEIAKYSPSEIISNRRTEIFDEIKRIFDINVNEYEGWNFETENSVNTLCSHFNVASLKGFSISSSNLCICACGGLLNYLLSTQKNKLSQIINVKKINSSRFMTLDISSRKNLELTASIRDGGKKGTLLQVLDHTKTAMGARLLRKWIEQPLTDKALISKRLESVGFLKDDPFSRASIRDILDKVYDIERLEGKISYGCANAKDLIALKHSIINLPELKNILKNINTVQFKDIYSQLDTLSDIYNLIDSSISDENPPVGLREGGLIKLGFNPEIDELRDIIDNTSGWLTRLADEEKKKTGIKNLKIDYNSVFGYYIEVTKSNLSLVPDTYIRKQTLTNAERFITPELKKLEEKMLNAKEQISEKEYNLFISIRNKVASEVERVQKTAMLISVADVLQSLAESADRGNYCCAKLSDKQIIKIKNGRHPVVEGTVTEGFIPNDTLLDDKENKIEIITGPNMAGKSTFMRQTALLVLMTQMGSFIPADSAEIGIFDRIFTRVGASDDLATGQSTFMIEMSEVANILNNATSKSLLILDEIGRGTSTYEGFSIAWAVIEYISLKIKARTLFATHYHELTDLEGKVDGVKNYRVGVRENKGEVIFMRKIERGCADKSYGIHVAKLAGVPATVLKKAQNVLMSIEKTNDINIESIENNMEKAHESQKELVKNDIVKEVINDIASQDINRLSPFEAWQMLYELKNRLSEC